MKNYSIHVNKDEVLTRITAGAAQKTADENLRKKNLDLQLQTQMENAIKQVKSFGSARYTYGVFELIRKKAAGENCRREESRHEPPQNAAAEDFRQDEISLKGTSLCLRGRDIDTLLKECGRCILLALTIGDEVDRILKKAQISDIAEALILDFCASSAAEDLCRRIYTDLEEYYEKRGFFLTDRFSPGYGDLPIQLQGEICRVLQTDRRLGLTSNSSSMLIPSKSITAVIGISHLPQPKKISGCAHCKMKNTCNFRKAGQTCE